MIKHRGKFVTIVQADEGKGLVLKGQENVKVFRAIFAGDEIPEFEEVEFKKGE